MTTRSYGDSCGIARALDLVGDRWSLLVVRELLLGAKRFTDLQAGLGRIGPDVLAQRLRDLEDAGLVERDGRARVYRLSEQGRGLEPVLLALGRFGSRLPIAADAAALGPDATGVALLTMFDPAAAGDLRATYELRLDRSGHDPLELSIADGRLRIVRAPADRPLAVVTTTPEVLVAVLWHGRALAEAEAAGDFTIEGDRVAAHLLLGLFAPR